MTVFLDARRAAVLRRHLLPEDGRGGMPAFTELLRRDRRGVAQPPRASSTSRPTSSPRLDRPGDRRQAPPTTSRRSRRRSAQALTELAVAPHRRPVGRLRQRPEVPADDEPRAPPARPRPQRRRPTRSTIVTTSLDAMATGGIYDHLGGGFARYSVDERVAGARTSRRCSTTTPCSRACTSTRWQVTGEAALPPGRRRDDRLRAARPPAPDRAASTRPRTPTPRALEEGKFYVWTLDEVGEVARRRDADAAPSSGTASREAGNFEGAQHPVPARCAATSLRPDRDRGGPPGAVRAPRPARPARPRRQGPDRVERAAPVDARRGRRRHRRRRRGSTPPSPTPSSCSRTCATPTAAGSRSWQARRRRPPPRVRRRPRRARRRLHPPRRAHRRGPLDRRGPRRRPTPCSTCSGTPSTVACSRPATTPSSWSPAQGPARQRHAVGQQHDRHAPAAALGPDRCRALPAPGRADPGIADRVAGRHPGGFGHLLARSTSTSGQSRSPSSATGPIWSAWCRRGTCPTRSRRGEPYRVAAVGGRRGAQAYVCSGRRTRRYGCGGGSGPLSAIRAVTARRAPASPAPNARR